MSLPLANNIGWKVSIFIHSQSGTYLLLSVESSVPVSSSPVVSNLSNGKGDGLIISITKVKSQNYALGSQRFISRVS